MENAVKAGVTLPFQVNVDEQGNAVNAVAQPEEKKRRQGRPRKPISGETFIVISDGSASVCSKEDLVAVASKTTSPEIYLVGKKVKSIIMTQAKVDLIANKKLTEETLEIEYD